MAHEMPGDLTRDELAAIGRVVVESAQLEYTVEVLICELTGLTLKQGAIFLAKGMFASKLDVLSNVVTQWLTDSPELLAEAQALISEMGENNAQRTTVVHGVWSNTDLIGREGLIAFQARPYKATKVNRLKESRTVDIDKVMPLAHKIRLTEAKARDLCRKIRLMRLQQ